MSTRRTPHADQRQITTSGLTPDGWRQLQLADRACCCSAGPDYLVVLPASGSRDHATELLFCGHHYRVSQQALGVAKATAFGRDGRSIPASHAPGLVRAR